MGHGHGHGHGHGLSAAGAHRRRLVVVLVITTAVLVVEVVAGLLTGSLALLADAGHLFTDSAGIGLALLAVQFAARPATPERTYGYYRLEILAAMANAVLLLGVSVAVLAEAWRRWAGEPQVSSGPMLVVAVLGLVANAASMLVLRAGARESLNLRGAYLEVLGDALGSVAVIVAALVIAVTGWVRADVVASVVVALLILPRTWSLLREAIDVLLQATPKDVDLAEVRAHIEELPGVLGAHDLHAWTLTSGVPVLSVHVVVDEAVLADGGGGRVLDALADCLGDHFDVEHCTFQLEPPTHAAHERSLHA